MVNFNGESSSSSSSSSSRKQQRQACCNYPEYHRSNITVTSHSSIMERASRRVGLKFRSRAHRITSCRRPDGNPVVGSPQ
ncbi:hypothetical protein M0802_003179 [Mischocyttarus mexicanus]|nr:hypothetical protein M0802_003179 [Mischocyttarus mexicanus]